MTRKYASIDLETTGLDHHNDQVLEIGVVFDDLDDPKPLEELKRFHAYVAHPRLHGHPKAIAMNATAIQRIADRVEGFRYLDLGDVVACIAGETNAFFGDMTSHQVAGRNFDAFDRRFLERLPCYSLLNFTVKSWDPATHYKLPEDRRLPSLQKCIDRAGFAVAQPHTALGDAMLVVRCLRKAVIGA